MVVALPPRMPREVWVLVAGSFVVAIGFGLVAPALPTYAKSFGITTTAVTIIISAFAASRLIFAPVAGRFLLRWSERPVYLTGLGIVAVSNVAFAFAPAYEWLIAARVFGGIGSTMFTISSFALLIRVTPPAIRGKASALYSTGFLIGNISGPLLGGLLVGFSIRAPFLFYAGALVIAMALVQFLLGRGPAAPAKVISQVPTMGVLEAFRSAAFRGALASSFSVGWAVYGIRIALIPLFVGEILNERPSVSGYALTVFAAGNAAVLPFAGRWVDRLGRKPAVMAGLLISAVATGSIGVSGSTLMLLIVCFVGGIGSGLITPGQQAVVADVVGGRPAGPVLAAFQMSSDIGAVTGPVIAGILVDAQGFGFSFIVAGAVVGLAFLPWLWAPETLPSKQTGTAKE